jgi:glycosyltransferase involved in cell wall biosynthesis
MARAELDTGREARQAPAEQHPRIAYFTESLLPWVDGVSRTLGVLFDDLETRGRDFRIYAPIASNGEYSWSHRVTQVRSVSFPLYRDYRVSIPERGRLAEALDDFAPDMIHVCSPTPAGVWAQSYARSRGIPVVGSFHTHFAAYFRYYRAGYLEGAVWRALHWFYNRCEATLTPSASMIRELQAHGIRNARIWSRGVDCELFSPERRDPALRAEIGLDEEMPLLLMVSRLVKEKDLLDLVAMDRILRERGLRYRLAIVGNGPLRRKLERGLPDAVFAGSRTGEELARWYASADVFVFPSTTESFGNVVQEAMASGLPAVVTDRGGPAGVIAPGLTGLVARAYDPVDLADKTAALMAEPARRRDMGGRGRQLALSRSWEEVNNGLLREYDAVWERASLRASRPRVRQPLLRLAARWWRRRRSLASTDRA